MIPKHRYLLVVGGLAFEVERDIRILQRFDRGFRNNVFTRFENLTGEPSQQKREGSSFCVLIGKADRNHLNERHRGWSVT